VSYLSCERRSYNELVLITEMMTRGSFKEYLSGLKQPRMSICQNWFQQILTGLNTLHAKGITHGRLSCEHIFINSNTGEVKIGDLSLVKLKEVTFNRLLPHRPIDDIHQFGLLVLEIAFFQLLPYSKLKSVMNKHYDSMSLDIKKIESLTQYVEDETYRSLILYCVNAGSDITANDVLGHPFFTRSYAKEETLKVARSKRKSLTEASTPNSPLENEKALTVISNAFKPTVNQRIDMSLKIVLREKEVLINFEYDLQIDSPEKLAQEMREILALPEIYILTFQKHLKQSRIIFC
jgi:serine/threonine protein kinase